MDRHYVGGLDVLGGTVIGDGLSATDFVPWLNVVSKIASGAGSMMQQQQDAKKGPKTAEEAVAKALEEERKKQAKERAEADAKRTRTIVYGTLGLLGATMVGLLGWIAFKK